MVNSESQSVSQLSEPSAEIIRETTAVESPTDSVEQPASSEVSTPSVVDRMLAESKSKSDNALAAFEKTLQSADGELLDQFGGDEWKHIQTLRQDA